MNKTDSNTVVNLLIDMNAEFFLAEKGEPCVSIRDGERLKTFLINSNSWQDWIIRFLRSRSLKLTEYQRKELNSELMALSSESDSKRPVYVRIGKLENDIYIDLNNEEYEVVKINSEGFSIVKDPEVPFVRPAKQRPLPRPIRTQKKELLRLIESIFPTKDNEHLLILAFLLKCLLRDSGAYAILVLEGQQGSGKTILSGRLKSIIDPSEPASYSPPKNSDDIIVASAHSYLLMFDNISGFDGEMADVFCRLSTGGGISKRKLYKDDEEAFYKLHRPCIINGISEPSDRADFLDRCVTIELEPIKDKNRISESELNTQFERILPQINGGLYGLLSECLKILPGISTSNLPRMTEFARLGIAIEKSLGLQEGMFLKTYAANRNKQIEDAFWNDDLCCAIYSYFFPVNGQSPIQTKELNGTANKIKYEVSGGNRLFKNRPLTARGFSSWLKRVEPLLKNKGILVQRLPRRASSREMRIYLKEV